MADTADIHTDQMNDYNAKVAEAVVHEAEYKLKHAGHESMHFYMMLILVFLVLGVQMGVLAWKNKHYRSYQFVSLTGLWLFPPLFFYFKTEERTFISVWACFSVLNSWIIYSASKSPLHHLTPRLVYKWFQITHNISYVVGIIGYVCMMTVMFLVPPPDSPQSSETTGMILSLPLIMLIYGLYFGVLSRDFAELCSDRMASTLGYYVKGGIPNKEISHNMCAICGWYLKDTNNSETSTLEDEVYKLDCNHEFHDKCIRGWCLIGKKDMCPYCHEKVNLKQLSRNPWDTQQIFYLNLLDWLRYLIVWQPVIIVLIQASYYLFGLS